MKYFKIDFKNYYNLGRVPSYANGETIHNAEKYFNAMRDGSVLREYPNFDSFFLESYDNKEYWEWKLCDVHKFTRTASLIGGWLISEKLNLLLKNYNLSKPHNCYPSKLLYKEEKIDYYIFQFTGELIYKKTTEYIDYKKSKFLNPSMEAIVTFLNNDDYAQQSDNLYFEKKTDFIKIKIALKEELDFFPMQSFLGDNLVSERLKNAMEEQNIEGFEFSDLHYEVVTEPAFSLCSS